MANKLLFNAASVVLLLAAWHAVTALGWISPLFLPAPLEVMQTLWNQLVVTKEVWTDVAATLWRTLAGYLLGAAVGVAGGILLGYSARAHDSLEFLMYFLGSLPAVALFPLFLLVFGIGDEAKIAVTIWASAFLVLLNTMYGVRNASRLRQMVGRTMNIGRLRLLWKIILPDALPYVFAGLRIALSFCLVVIIITEMQLGTTIGLGNRIINEQLVYHTPEMYAAIILTGMLGYLLNRAFAGIEKRAVHWSGK